MNTTEITQEIEKIKQLMNTVQVAPSGATSEVASGSTKSFPRTITTDTSALNARIAPDKSAQLSARSYDEQTFIAIGAVCGERVEGENRWWVTHQNTYVWSGGTTEKPNLACSSF